MVPLGANNQANLEKSTYHKQPWMVWGTKTQNSGDRPSRENKREEISWNVLKAMGFRISRIKKDDTKPGWQCKKIQERRMGKYGTAERVDGRTTYTRE